MKQNKTLQQNYTFSVLIENSNTGQSAWLKLPSTRNKTKEVFSQLHIKMNQYLVSECNFYIEQISQCITRCRNLDEINYFASIFAQLDEEEREKIRLILTSGCDEVYSVAEAINLIFAKDYTFYFLEGTSTYENVCKFHLNSLKLSRNYIPLQHIPRDKYDQIGREMAISERGRFIEGLYVARTRNYYPDVYEGKVPVTYRITDYR